MAYDIENIKDGVYYDMTIEEYHGNKTHFSSSSLKESYKSMAHFKHYLDTEVGRKSHFDFGNAFELSITDYEVGFKNKVAVFNDSEIIEEIKKNRPEIISYASTTEYKKWKDGFYKKNEDKLILSLDGKDSLEVLVEARKSFHSHPSAVALIKDSNFQTSIFWTCPDTGMKLKTRPDFWKPQTEKRTAIITDLKTDKDSDSVSHIKTICNLNYPIQAVLQLMGLRHFNLIDEGARFFWLVCSKSAPYNTEVYEFDSTDIAVFTDSVKFKLGEIKRAIDKGMFLSYEIEKDAGIKDVRFPFYYKQQLGISDPIDN